MSSRIKPLSLQLANQIAAGEVVERPSSVVKEGLENAIDAHSNQIQIDIEEGGRALIRIIDNGEGINKDDLALAVTRHATSKLTTLNELEQMMSLGFRGEALASISAVSRLSLKSKLINNDHAWKINTGTDNDFTDYYALPEPTAHPQGTTLEVRDLFFNTPARRKFMRTVKTEFKHIDDIIKRIALSQFEIGFKLTHNKKLLKNLPKAVTEKARLQRISTLFSADFIDNAKTVDFSAKHLSDMGEIRLWGWISQPQWHRKQSDWQFFYVNGRYIKDKLIYHALRQAYQECLPDESYSAYLLYLEIDPQQVDVNVHPTKHEVRFRQTRLVHDFIYSGLKEALFSEQVSSNDQSSVMKSHEQQPHNNSHQPLVNDHHYYPQKKINQYQVAEPFTSPQVKQSLCFGTSLGCMIPNYVMSQVINNEKNTQIFIINVIRTQQFLLKQLFQSGQSHSLLIPETVSDTSQHITLILTYQSKLKQWGLELDQLGEDSIMVRSLPSLYKIPSCKINITLLIRSLLGIMKDKKDLCEVDIMTALVNAIYSKILMVSEQTLLLSLLTQQIDQQGFEKVSQYRPRIWKIMDESSLNTFLD